MAPDMNPGMEELNKRRVERQQRRREAVARNRRKRVYYMIGLSVLLVVIGAGVFFLSQMKDEAPETTEYVTHSGEEASEKDTVIHLVAAGDVNITDAVVNAGGEEYDYTDTFLDIAPLLAEGDLTVLNLEGNLCGAPYGSNTRSAPQSLAEALSRCGVDMVQLANSYAINHGISGLQATIRSVKAAGMEPLGVFNDTREYRASKGYTIREVEGIKIAFVAFTKGMDGMKLPQGSENCVNVLYTDYDSTYQELDTDAIHKVLDAVEAESPDLTVVMLHWGSEYNDTVSESQESLVTLLQERGVDAIIGTHPHYVQQMTYDPETGNFVAYSLGDLISDGTRAGTEYSVILNLEITKSGRKTKITGYTYTPIFTVAERGAPVRSIRLTEAVGAYDSNYVQRVKDSTYDAMTYAQTRIEERIRGE